MAELAAPLLVIVGPTASGKTALAIELAEMFDGEIICADSRTVYKGLDIGTAKPTQAEQARVPHHLLDIVNPDEPFTVADFKQRANKMIKIISARGKLPIMVGGSGLYIDAVLFDYMFAPIGVARNPVNPRHVREDIPTQRGDMREHTLVIGLNPTQVDLHERIRQRVDNMDIGKLVEEAQWLLDNFPGSKAADAPGYKALRSYLHGEISLDEAKSLFIQNDINLSRRQKTWFKRNKSIHWFDNREQAVDIATTFLNKMSD